jgi:hypothetical protein
MRPSRRRRTRRTTTSRTWPARTPLDRSLDGGDQDQRNHDQPQPAAAASGTRASRSTEPERFPDDGPAKGSLLAPHEDDHEHELPDQPGHEADEQRLQDGHVFLAAEMILEGRSDEPGRRRHRERRGSPDGQHLQKRVLRNLDRGRSFGMRGGFSRLHGKRVRLVLILPRSREPCNPAGAKFAGRSLCQPRRFARGPRRRTRPGRSTAARPQFSRSACRAGRRGSDGAQSGIDGAPAVLAQPGGLRAPSGAP